MSVYLGTKGAVHLRRTFDGGEISTSLNNSEIDASKKRIAFDFASRGDISELITGDELEVRADSNLVFIDSYSKKTGNWWVNVDELGGVRLYASYAHAISGGVSNAITLSDQSAGWSLNVRITVQNKVHRLMGQITSYELNTNRETIDVSSLGQDFRKQYSSLMSGSGRLEIIWDYRDSVGAGEYETAQYLQQLLLRSEIGSVFDAHLYLKQEGYSPSGAAGTSDDVIWYEIYGVITNTAVAFNVNEIVKMTADFVTTGTIKLKVMTYAEYKVLQETLDDILLEQDASAKLLQEAF